MMNTYQGRDHVKSFKVFSSAIYFGGIRQRDTSLTLWSWWTRTEHVYGGNLRGCIEMWILKVWVD